MTIAKSHILNEIRRTANENGGEPLGAKRFEAETGIRYVDWHGVYWARWGDALVEAGYAPNTLQGPYATEHVLREYAALALELGRLPVRGDLKLKRRSDPKFPSWNVFSRFGSKANLLQKVADFCRAGRDFDNVAEWCDNELQSLREPDGDAPSVANEGYVYLIKHGSRSEYRIGCTTDPLRREGELRIQLPEKASPVHIILTDDPYGIEAYWHKRFADKRMNGDWFKLTRGDVAAFKRRRFM